MVRQKSLQPCPPIFHAYFWHCTDVRFASFFSSGFITAIVVNPPESSLAQRISVCSGVFYQSNLLLLFIGRHFNCNFIVVAFFSTLTI